MNAAEPASFHDVPRLSASGLHRLENCAASHARSLEMHEFCREQGIAGPAAGAAAEQGSKLHALLQSVPYRNAVLGTASDGGDGEAPREHLLTALRRLAPRAGIHDLSSADLWFSYHAIRARDRFITHVLERSPDLARPLQSVSFNFDQRRLFVEYAPAADEPEADAIEFSGLPDVQVHAVDARGSHHAFICDYKSGYAEHLESESNRQLTALVALAESEARAQGFTFDSIHVKTLTRLDLCPPVDDPRPKAPPTLPRYGPEQIAQALAFTEARVREAARVAAPLERHFADGGAGALPDALKADLHERAHPGSHCLYCDGKTCCTRLRQSIAEYRQEQLGPAAREALRATSDRLANPPDPDSMELQDVTQFYEQTSRVINDVKVFEQAHRETAEVMRQLMAPPREGESPRPLPGAYLKPGARKLAVRDRAPLPGEGPESAAGEPQEPMPATAAEVFTDLLPVAGGKGEYEFVIECCDVNPQKVRAMLADLHGIPESKVWEQLLAPLPNNPFVQKPNKPSVVLGVPKVEAKQEEGRPARARSKAAAAAPTPPLSEAEPEASEGLPSYLQADRAPQEEHPAEAMSL